MNSGRRARSRVPLGDRAPEQPSDRAKRAFFAFTFFNVVSFSFIGNDIMTLYSVRLEATSVFIGLISAFFYMTFLFTLIGRSLVRRMGAVHVFGRFWTLRYVLMIPVALTALPFLRDERTLVFLLIAAGTLGFNVSKGMAIAAHPPIVGEITGDRDRGSFLSRNQLIIHTMRVVTGVIMAVLLAREGAIGTYAAFILVGVGAGLLASRMVFKLPEPASARRGFETRMRDNLRSAFSEPYFIRLMIVAALTVFVVSMGTPFLVVFFKRIYGHTDSAVVLFGVAGSVGAASMALITGFLVDRIGAKPLIAIFAAVLAGVLVLIVVQPGVGGGAVAFVVPAIVYFLFQMGLFGLQTSADTYFFAASAPEQRLDIGIIFSLSKGIAGLTGGLIGGVYLSALTAAFPANEAGAFQVYFGTMILLVATIGFMATRLPDKGPFSIQDAIGILFSPRDLRAIRLLNRLDRSRTHGEERRAVEALRSSGSPIPVTELLSRLVSPSLFVRTEALQAIRSGPIDAEVEQRLIHEVTQHGFTTAHLAAETMGERGVKSGIPVLRAALGSTDYLLCSKAMIALARLGDRNSLERILSMFQRSQNPRMIIYGAKALEIFADARVLPVMLERLANAEFPFVREDLVVSVAGLFGMSQWFYPLYSTYVSDRSEGMAALDAQVGQAASVSFTDRVETLCGRRQDFQHVVPRLLGEETVRLSGVDVSEQLSRAAADAQLSGLPQFRFLMVALLVFLSLSRSGT